MMAALKGQLRTCASGRAANRREEVKHVAEPSFRVNRVLADPLEVFDQLALLGDIE